LEGCFTAFLKWRVRTQLVVAPIWGALVGGELPRLKGVFDPPASKNLAGSTPASGSAPNIPSEG
jgi:hypothetical protein